MITLWKMQTQTVLRSYLSKNRAEKLDTCWLGSGEKEPSCSANGNGNFATTMEISMETPQKNRVTVITQVSILGYMLGTGKMAQPLRAFPGVSGDLNLVPCTHMW